MEFNQINTLLRNPSWDVIAIFAFIAVGFFYGISAGKAKMISFLFSLYVGGFLFDNFSYLDGLLGKRGNVIEAFLSRLFIFFVMIILLNLLFAKVLRCPCEGNKKWWQVLLLSFLSTGLIFSYIFHLFPAREVFTFSPVVQNLFVSEAAFFWWLTLPLIALFLARK